MNPLLRLCSVTALALLLSGGTSVWAASAREDAYAKLSKRNWGEVKRDFLGHFLLGFVDAPQGISNPNLTGIGRREAIYTNDRGERIGIVFVDLVQQDYDAQKRAGGGSIPSYYGGFNGHDVLVYALRHSEPTLYLKDMFHAIKKIHENIDSVGDTAKAAAKASDMKDFLIVLNYAFQQERDYQRGVDYGQAETRTQSAFNHALCDRDDLLGSPILPEVLAAIPGNSGVQVPKYFTCVSVGGPTAAAVAASSQRAAAANGRAATVTAGAAGWSNRESEDIPAGASRGAPPASGAATRGAAQSTASGRAEDLESQKASITKIFVKYLYRFPDGRVYNARDIYENVCGFGVLSCGSPYSGRPQCESAHNEWCACCSDALASWYADMTRPARSHSSGPPPPSEYTSRPSGPPPDDGRYHVPVLENAIRAKNAREGR